MTDSAVAGVETEASRNPLGVAPRTMLRDACQIDGRPLRRDDAQSFPYPSLRLGVAASRNPQGWTLRRLGSSAVVGKTPRLTLDRGLLIPWFDALQSALSPFPVHRIWITLSRPLLGLREPTAVDAEDVRRALAAFGLTMVRDYRRAVQDLIDRPRVNRDNPAAGTELAICGARLSYHRYGAAAISADLGAFDRLRRDLRPWLSGLVRFMLETEHPMDSAHGRAVFLRETQPR